MPLNEQYQLSLLQDILRNHQIDCCGTVSEYEQMQRLIHSLQGHKQVNNEMNNTLVDVYNYSLQGQNADNIDDHILKHKENFEQWINNLNDLNLT